jgi:hypothetical protein
VVKPTNASLVSEESQVPGVAFCGVAPGALFANRLRPSSTIGSWASLTFIALAKREDGNRILVSRIDLQNAQRLALGAPRPRLFRSGKPITVLPGAPGLLHQRC